MSSKNLDENNCQEQSTLESGEDRSDRRQRLASQIGRLLANAWLHHHREDSDNLESDLVAEEADAE